MLELDVLGPMLVRADGEPAEVRGKRRQMLLLALAARLGRSVPVDELAEIIWGEQLPGDPPASVHALVSRLRRDLGVGRAALLTESGYRLDPAAVRIDADQFEATVVRLDNDSFEVEPERRAQLLRSVLALWRGPAWQDLPDDIVAVARASRAAVVRRTALEMLAAHVVDHGNDGNEDDGNEDEGNWTEGSGDLGLFEAAAEEYPFSEKLAAGVAVERDRSGRRVEAVRGLGQFIARVRNETGLDPGPELLRLESRLIAGTTVPVAEPARRRTHQRRTAQSPGGPAPGGLIGRGDDLDLLKGRLGEHRLVTVVGAGGVGKTALSEALARPVEGDYPGGIYRCELAPLRSPDAVPFALNTSLGLNPRSALSPLEQAVDFLGPRVTLLVLDNCEHLRDAVAGVVEELLGACPHLTVLATSREPLGVRSEYRFELSPLATDGPDRSTASPVSSTSPAVELFLARAREAGVSDVNSWVGEAERICEALGGLPLAIELAASRCRSMAIPELAAHLTADPSVLRDQRGRRPQRHRSFDATIAWSYDSLATPTQQLFRVMSVFVGGFDRDAVSSVAGATSSQETLEDALDELVDKSLVEADLHGRRARLRMLEPLRQFGERRLGDAGEVRSAKDAHLAYCRRTARTIADCVSGPAEREGVALAALELANLRAGHQHAITTQQVDAAMEIVAALHDYAIWRENYELGRWAEQSLGHPDADAHPLAPVVYATAGWAHNKAGRYEQAVRFAMSGLTAEQRGADPTGWCHDVLAHTAYWTGHHDRAVAWATEEIGRGRDARDAARVAYMLGDLAAHSAHADPAHAESQIRRNHEAVDLARAIGIPSLLAFALHALGSSLCFRDNAAAYDVLEQSLELGEDVDCRFVLTAAAQHLAAIHCSQGRWRAAVDVLQPTLERFARGADPAHVGMVARVLAAPLAHLEPARGAADLVTLVGYGLGTPGPRIPDIDARNDELIVEWERTIGKDRVAQLLDHGGNTDAREVIDRLAGRSRRVLGATNLS